jgi:pimeloyl-ACP methyl ester carboxylesterase
MLLHTEFVNGPAGDLEIMVGRHTQPRGAVIFLHGIQGTAASWRPVLPHLTLNRTLLMPNLRGRGASVSPGLPSAYGIDDFASDLDAVVAFAEAHCPAPLAIVAWSMGVLVTLAHVRRHGAAAFDRIVLVSGTPCPGGEAVWFRGEDVAAISAEAVARAEALALPEAAAPVAVAGAWLSARMADELDTLALIDTPTLVMHGAADAECPLAHARLMHHRIAGASLSIWQGAPHNLMAFDPARFAREIDGFLDQAAVLT